MASFLPSVLIPLSTRQRAFAAADATSLGIGGGGREGTGAEARRPEIIQQVPRTSTRACAIFGVGNAVIGQ